MSKIIIIRGNSGSGKTTIAKELHNLLGSKSLLISQDYVRRTMLMVHDRPGNLAIDLIETMLNFGIKNCEYTILEGILAKNKYGEMLTKCIEKADTSFIYYYDLSFEETLKRHLTKKEANFGEKEMKSWFTAHDFLGAPNEKILTNTLSKDETLNLICRDLDLL